MLSLMLLSAIPAEASARGGMADDTRIQALPRNETVFAQMRIEQRVIIRVPMMRRDMPPHPARPPAQFMDERQAQPLEWQERKGPKCLRIRDVRAAAITSARGVDLVLKGRERIRARLGRECRPADLYSGFYIQPSDDGELCAERDRVLARSGADCEITAFKRLVPDR